MPEFRRAGGKTAHNEGEYKADREKRQRGQRHGAQAVPGTASPAGRLGVGAPNTEDGRIGRLSPLPHRGKDIPLDIRHHAVIENHIIQNGEHTAHRGAKLRFDMSYS